MSKAISVTALSTLGVNQEGGAVEVTPYANASPTAEKAPVLLTIESRGSVNAEAFAARLLGPCPDGTLAQARLALNALGEVLCDVVENDDPCDVDLGFVSLVLEISGSVPEADAQTTDDNKAYWTGLVPERYRRQFANFDAKIDAGSAPAKLTRVRDKATNRPLVDGANPFYLEGRGMTFGGEGEKLELLHGKTGEKICDVAVSDHASRIAWTCALPSAAPAAKKHVLRLTTLGGGESTLWPLDLGVEVRGAPPAPEPYAESSDGLVKITSFRRNAEGTAELVVDTAMGQSTTLRFGGTGLDLLWNAPGGRATPLITLCCGDTEDQNLMCSGQPHGDYLLADWTPSSVCGWEAGEHDVTVKVSYGAEDPEILSFHATFNIAE